MMNSTKIAQLSQYLKHVPTFSKVRTTLSNALIKYKTISTKYFRASNNMKTITSLSQAGQKATWQIVCKVRSDLSIKIIKGNVAYLYVGLYVSNKCRIFRN